MDLEKISYRKANNTIEDFIILRSIHKAVMYSPIILTLGKWDSDFQEQRLKKHFEEAYKTLEFIYYEGTIIGTVNARKKEFDDGEYGFIEQLYILDKYQGKGLGSHILKNKLMNEEIRLSVLRNDDSANAFYVKNNFEQYKEDEYQKYYKRVPKLENKIKI